MFICNKCEKEFIMISGKIPYLIKNFPIFYCLPCYFLHFLFFIYFFYSNKKSFNSLSHFFSHVSYIHIYLVIVRIK